MSRADWGSVEIVGDEETDKMVVKVLLVGLGISAAKENVRVGNFLQQNERMPRLVHRQEELFLPKYNFGPEGARSQKGVLSIHLLPILKQQ